MGLESDTPLPAPSANGGKLSAVENVKENSNYLRGTLADELVRDTAKLGDADKQLIKFHGSYQQDDRDARKDLNRQGAGRAFQFMVRCKIPGGKLTAPQYLALDDLATRYANGTLRITSRQGIQFHGVLKRNLKRTIADINHCLLTTLGACGDVSRNVMAPAAPVAGPVHAELQRRACEISEHFAPRSTAYHEIWLQDKPMHASVVEAEPIYGKTYLPRKFKIAFALPEDNSVDLFAQDLAFLAHVVQDRIIGYNVYAGGGMGMSHGNALTFPFLAQPVMYITPDQVTLAAEAVVKLFRDHGNRADRKRARLKYVLHEWGIERFRKVLQTYLSFESVPPRAIPVTGAPLHHGWHAQGDGNYFYGIHVLNGRIKDDDPALLRSALRSLVVDLQPEVRLTPGQDLLLCNLPADAQSRVEAALAAHRVFRPMELSLVRRHSLACPAMPTCGLALSESERVAPQLLAVLEAELVRLGLENETIGIRMTGCPNGCARPYQSDIGVVGRSGDKYTIFVGGNLVGSRLNFVFKDLVPFDQIVAVLSPLLTRYKDQRTAGEGFGDYCQRLGPDGCLAVD